MDKKHLGGANIEKITIYAIIINACQIAAILAVAVYSLVTKSFKLSDTLEHILIGVTALVVIWGAAVDIREAFSARKASRQRDMLTDAYAQLEELNATLRAQRHDFMNHIQVIYSLTEMGEHESAMEYLDRVYDDIRRVGKSLKTSVPAVNALIAAKTAACAAEGIELVTDISSPWQGFPAAGWEMCRVLGNLIDNAIDAASAQPGGRIKVSLWEDIRAYRFSVENTGAPIPPSLREMIYQTGFSTKGGNRGMGLSITRGILESMGGGIELDDESENTRFNGWIPKSQAVVPADN